MAMYECATRTNHFRVTDEDRYKELFNNLDSDYGIEDFSVEKDGVIYHSFGAYSSIYYADENNQEIDFDYFLDELQKIIPSNEAFILTEAGHEKLRYISALTIIVTKKEIITEDMNVWAYAKAKELVGNEFVSFDY